MAKIVNKNAARVAEVWMDEWRDFYYSMNPGARNVDIGEWHKRDAETLTYWMVPWESRLRTILTYSVIVSKLKKW